MYSSLSGSAGERWTLQGQALILDAKERGTVSHLNSLFLSFWRETLITSILSALVGFDVSPLTGATWHQDYFRSHLGSQAKLNQKHYGTDWTIGRGWLKKMAL